MWFINFLFGKKTNPVPPPPDHAASAPVAQAPGTQIAYSPELIGQLKGDHQRLLELFGHISAAFAGSDLAAAARLLGEFRRGILSHLLTENVRFYIYLEHTLKHDSPNEFDLMRHFRHEMDSIGKAVLAFLDKYQSLDKQPDLAAAFGKDLENVGAILGERIRREEETLYPLYLPAIEMVDSRAVAG